MDPSVLEHNCAALAQRVIRYKNLALERAAAEAAHAATLAALGAAEADLDAHLAAEGYDAAAVRVLGEAAAEGVLSARAAVAALQEAAAEELAAKAAAAQEALTAQKAQAESLDAAVIAMATDRSERQAAEDAAGQPEPEPEPEPDPGASEP